ncbi:MAG TPA: hypothetical protein VJ878_00140 [Candidatus Izemoplasmatales bacterium]|nr:hypothetical protein [Candidatus Izemoplasmatales bacterium]
MVVPAIFIILFGVFFGLVGFRFMFKAEKTIRRLQEMKYKGSSQPTKQAIFMTRIFGVILFLIGIYFIGVGINVIIN